MTLSKGSISRLSGDLIRYLVLSLALLVVLFPAGLMFLTAFKTETEIVHGFFTLPEGLHLDNFVTAWIDGGFGTYFRNSLMVSAAVVGASVPLTIFTGYGFGRFQFPGRNILFFLFLLGMMVPMEAVIIPLYYNMRALSLLDTYWALILPQVAVSMSFGTFWMRAFFRNVPQELVDASVMDGCSSWDTLWKVLLPLARPAVLALAVLFLIWSWNEFLMVLVLVSREDLRTMPAGMAFFQGQHASSVTGLATGGTIISLPTIVAYILLQRHFIRGMTAGAVKG